MYDLKCGQKDCRYNHGYCCCAKDIAVSSGTCCTTYCKSDVEGRNINTESAAEFSKPDFSVDTAVSCNAPCLFNHSTKCIANGITVSTAEDGIAECLTFIKK
ncbi:MAG: DUF1540 domain-containing protein [Clostridiales bacterium]|nr:DUF1540 domain-containing protein [Clostridiales bacterium]